MLTTQVSLGRFGRAPGTSDSDLSFIQERLEQSKKRVDQFLSSIAEIRPKPLASIKDFTFRKLVKKNLENRHVSKASMLDHDYAFSDTSNLKLLAKTTITEPLPIISPLLDEFPQSPLSYYDNGVDSDSDNSNNVDDVLMYSQDVIDGGEILTATINKPHEITPPSKSLNNAKLSLPKKTIVGPEGVLQSMNHKEYNDRKSTSPEKVRIYYHRLNPDNPATNQKPSKRSLAQSRPNILRARLQKSALDREQTIYKIKKIISKPDDYRSLLNTPIVIKRSGVGHKKVVKTNSNITKRIPPRFRIVHNSHNSPVKFKVMKHTLNPGRTVNESVICESSKITKTTDSRSEQEENSLLEVSDNNVNALEEDIDLFAEQSNLETEMADIGSTQEEPPSIEVPNIVSTHEEANQLLVEQLNEELGNDNSRSTQERRSPIIDVPNIANADDNDENIQLVLERLNRAQESNNSKKESQLDNIPVPDTDMCNKDSIFTLTDAISIMSDDKFKKIEKPENQNCLAKFSNSRPEGQENQRMASPCLNSDDLDSAVIKITNPDDAFTCPDLDDVLNEIFTDPKENKTPLEAPTNSEKPAPEATKEAISADLIVEVIKPRKKKLKRLLPLKRKAMMNRELVKPKAKPVKMRKLVVPLYPGIGHTINSRIENQLIKSRLKHKTIDSTWANFSLSTLITQTKVGRRHRFYVPVYCAMYENDTLTLCEDFKKSEVYKEMPVSGKQEIVEGIFELLSDVVQKVCDSQDSSPVQLSSARKRSRLKEKQVGEATDRKQDMERSKVFKSDVLFSCLSRAAPKGKMIRMLASRIRQWFQEGLINAYYSETFDGSGRLFISKSVVAKFANILFDVREMASKPHLADFLYFPMEGSVFVFGHESFYEVILGKQWKGLEGRGTPILKQQPSILKRNSNSLLKDSSPLPGGLKPCSENSVHSSPTRKKRTSVSSKADEPSTNRISYSKYGRKRIEKNHYCSSVKNHKKPQLLDLTTSDVPTPATGFRDITSILGCSVSLVSEISIKGDKLKRYDVFDVQGEEESSQDIAVSSDFDLHNVEKQLEINSQSSQDHTYCSPENKPSVAETMKTVRPTILKRPQRMLNFEACKKQRKDSISSNTSSSTESAEEMGLIDKYLRETDNNVVDHTLINESVSKSLLREIKGKITKNQEEESSEKDVKKKETEMDRGLSQFFEESVSNLGANSSSNPRVTLKITELFSLKSSQLEITEETKAVTSNLNSEIIETQTDLVKDQMCQKSSEETGMVVKSIISSLFDTLFEKFENKGSGNSTAAQNSDTQGGQNMGSVITSDEENIEQTHASLSDGLEISPNLLEVDKENALLEKGPVVRNVITKRKKRIKYTPRRNLEDIKRVENNASPNNSVDIS